MVASCFYVLAVVVEIFPLCYYAQCLMDENNRLAEVIFHSNWINQNKRYRKMLIFFLQRSQKPIEFSAGKLFPITLSSFLSVSNKFKKKSKIFLGIQFFKEIFNKLMGHVLFFRLQNFHFPYIHLSKKWISKNVMV